MPEYARTGLAAKCSMTCVHLRLHQSRQREKFVCPGAIVLLLVWIACCFSRCEGQAAGCKPSSAFAVAFDTAFAESNKPVSFTVRDLGSVSYSTIPPSAESAKSALGQEWPQRN